MLWVLRTLDRKRRSTKRAVQVCRQRWTARRSGMASGHVTAPVCCSRSSRQPQSKCWEASTLLVPHRPRMSVELLSS